MKKIRVFKDINLGKKEPIGLEEILRLRPSGPRRIWNEFDESTYKQKVAGALTARMSGCILGALVEFWSVRRMQKWAKKCDDPFPPTDYWSKCKEPDRLRYSMSPRRVYLRDEMDGVPVDDDIIYTLLGLLIVEECGLDFTTDDVGTAWLKYLPYACTAEDIALKNLKKGIPADKAADIDNPYDEWIGAFIRSDPFAYVCPGLPEKAAKMAYHDAYLSHRKSGIYGEMFFSATQSAAFAVDNAVDAIKIGLTEIPQDCKLANEIRWALDIGDTITNYKDARKMVNKRYKGLHGVHTINNAVLSVWGLMIGGTDVTKVLSETVAMGLDNDCTAATAGSIVGAIVGLDGIPAHWYKNFNNKIHSYLNEHPEFSIDDVINRFASQARKHFIQ